MNLNKQDMEDVIRGSTVLGTGGGGRYDSALESIKDVANIELISATDLSPSDVVITAYGAGGLTKPKNTRAALQEGLQLLEKQLERPIKAIVPVEIGPYSLAVAFEMASQLGVPVVDGDLVGYRSVPEIYIELVTLANVRRTPLVFGNNEGDVVLLDNASSAESLESIIRSFADRSLSNTYVLGYPCNPRTLKKCLAKGSVSYCLEFSEKLNKDFQLIGSGKVTSDSKQELDGFTRGSLMIKDATSGKYRVEYKNEYLVLLKNEEVLVTCPDFICIVDAATALGLNNGDDNKGREVNIYVRPAIKQWRTAAGLSFFSPNKLGLDYKQKVLKESP